MIITEEKYGKPFLDAPMPRAYVKYLAEQGLKVSIALCSTGLGASVRFGAPARTLQRNGAPSRHSNASRHKHPKNRSDSLTLGDFARRPTRSFKPLHKICDFDLMFDAHIRDGHLHYAELFLDTSLCPALMAAGHSVFVVVNFGEVTCEHLGTVVIHQFHLLSAVNNYE